MINQQQTTGAGGWLALLRVAQERIKAGQTVPYQWSKEQR